MESASILFQSLENSIFFITIKKVIIFFLQKHKFSANKFSNDINLALHLPVLPNPEVSKEPNPLNTKNNILATLSIIYTTTRLNFLTSILVLGTTAWVTKIMKICIIILICMMTIARLQLIRSRERELSLYKYETALAFYQWENFSKLKATIIKKRTQNYYKILYHKKTPIKSLSCEKIKKE